MLCPLAIQYGVWQLPRIYIKFERIEMQKKDDILFALKNDVQYTLRQYWKHNPKEITLAIHTT